MTGSQVRFGEGNVHDGEGQFSPDGRWVTFSSSESGTDEIYVSSFRPQFGTKESSNKVATVKWRVSPAGRKRARRRSRRAGTFFLPPRGRPAARCSPPRYTAIVVCRTVPPFSHLTH